MSVAVKVTYKKEGDSDIRRFRVTEGDATSFKCIYNKVALLFPELEAGQFNLYWKDSDNDMVSCSTDDELMEALSSGNGSVLRLFVSTIDGTPRKATSDNAPLMGGTLPGPWLGGSAEGMDPEWEFGMHPPHFGPEMMDPDLCPPWMMRKMMKKMRKRMQKHDGCKEAGDGSSPGDEMDAEGQTTREGDPENAELLEETEVKCKKPKAYGGRCGHKRHRRRNKGAEENDFSNSSDEECPRMKWKMGEMGPEAGWDMMRSGVCPPPWLMRKMMRRMMKRMMMKQMEKHRELGQDEVDPEEMDAENDGAGLTNAGEPTDRDAKYKRQKGRGGRCGHKRHCRRNKAEEEMGTSSSSEEEGSDMKCGRKKIWPEAGLEMMRAGVCPPPWLMRKIMRKMMKRMMIKQLEKRGGLGQDEVDPDKVDPEKEAINAEAQEVTLPVGNTDTSEHPEDHGKKDSDRCGQRRCCRRNKGEDEGECSNSSDEECPEMRRGMGPGWGRRHMAPGARWAMRGMGPGARWGMGGMGRGARWAMGGMGPFAGWGMRGMGPWRHWGGAGWGRKCWQKGFCKEQSEKGTADQE